jgi:hypothetical protein
MSPAKKHEQLNRQLSILKKRLAATTAVGGAQAHLSIKKQKSQARFTRVRKEGSQDGAIGHYFITLDITAQGETVYVPLTIATGKKTAGFMYQIESTAEASVARAVVDASGKGVTLITLGTLVYVKILARTTVEFRIQVDIRGKLGKQYRLNFYRMSYKHVLTEARYQAYEKPMYSDTLKFS